MSIAELTRAERSVITAYVRLGSLVAVAAERGRSVKTVEAQAQIAREKCGGVALVQVAVLVDRESPIPFEPAKRLGGFE